ncbi:MAG: peptide chain release factor 2 [Candidatus Hydrogenedentes bacterium]|jgi:peptide chain release factor 2|nr:peptide chain release factor 2 [Candidatus Hydrogenedentota bacterium]
MYETELEALSNYAKRLKELRHCLNVDALNQEIAAIEKIMSAPGFWDNQETSQKVVQQLKAYKNIVATPDELRQEIEDTETLAAIAAEENDASLTGEIESQMESIKKKLDRLELNSLFMDPRDENAAIVNIHPGAGGTESCDWADILYRMIVRYCEQNEFEVEVLDYQPGDEAGLKSAALRVSGPFAYGSLKSEEGVHRLVRISPFDSNARRHTSFSAIEVLAEVDDTIDIEIREEDLKMDVYRSSGAGGQKVNKTSSAVRLTHLPTGIVVSCQIERSQHRNRETALSMLKAKLYDLELKRQENEMNAQRENQQDVAWGSQIRSYVLHPYQMIKDHRTNVETGNVNKVLDGDLSLFVEAFLKWNLERNAKTA